MNKFKQLMENGSWKIACKPPLPSNQKINQAKDAAIQRNKNGFDSASCPLCEVNYAIPSDFLSIIHYGLCVGCQLYKDKKLEYVVKYENPKIKEIKQRVKSGKILSNLEARILLERLHE